MPPSHIETGRSVAQRQKMYIYIYICNIIFQDILGGLSLFRRGFMESTEHDLNSGL